ncbi:MAG TPA: MAPEG family protein [Caulobacter sp.]|nr:MAPEG family protein [Caulobacter sp.]
MFSGLPYLQSTLAAALALVAWSLLIWIWMYAKRLPAMGKAKINPQDARFPGSLDVLPDDVRQAADNYNHLMEQPTIFYAVAIIAYLAGQSNALVGGLAWGYVTLRVLHSLLQVTVNIVPVRFLLFSLSTIVLMAMTVITACGALG